MKPSTLVFLRRKLGPWTTRSHPEREERDPEPPTHGREFLAYQARVLEDERRADLEYVQRWRRELLGSLAVEPTTARPEEAATASRP